MTAPAPRRPEVVPLRRKAIDDADEIMKVWAATKLKHSKPRRRPKASDMLIAYVAMTAAFFLALAPYFPLVSHYEMWSDVVRLCAFVSMFGLATFAGGYWLAAKRLI